MHPKFKAGGVGGAIALVAIFIAKQLHVDLDAETAAAIAVLVTQIGVWTGPSAQDGQS